MNLLCSALLLFAPAIALGQAQAPNASVPKKLEIDRQVGSVRELKLETGQNLLLVLTSPVGRVSVADPQVADLKVVTPTQLLLTAKGVGSTDLTLWDKSEAPLVIALSVQRNLDGLRAQLAELFPGEAIKVSAAGELVVLSGEVSDVRLPERIVEVAKLHAEKVANLLRVAGNQQVQIQVRFAEVSRSSLRELGFNFFHRAIDGQSAGGIARSPAGQFLNLPTDHIPGTSESLGMPPVVQRQPVTDAFSLFFSSIRGGMSFSAILNLLENNGLARTLAEPTLVTLSGQEAKFLAGGEIPIPIASTLGQVSVTWKKFGVLLHFTPTVLADNNIHLNVASEVSDLNPNAAITVAGFTIPGLTSRQSETTVRLGDGQSFAIAGLLSDTVRSQVDKVPGFGDIPILGALFRSTSYRREETELLVIVTAHLARPMEPHEVPALPTDSEPANISNLRLFLLGWDGSTARDDVALQKEGRGPAGPVGFAR